jgi:argininosuccinate lyase
VKEGIPFRDAYKAVSETIKKASFSKRRYLIMFMKVVLGICAIKK